MKLAIILIITGLAAYNFGLVIDVAANGDDSKLSSLAQTGQINSKWLPFALADKIIQTNSYSETFPFGGGPYAFLETAFLLEENQVFDHATIDFTISMDTKPDGTFINRVTECIFETDVDIDTECVVCLLKDWEGENIAKGEQFFTPPYLANTPLPLEMTIFLNDDEFITDVRNVKGIKIGICQELPPTGGDGEGCTPGYWRQTQHFGSWTDPPYSPDVPLTTYRAAFDLDIAPYSSPLISHVHKWFPTVPRDSGSLSSVLQKPISNPGIIPSGSEHAQLNPPANDSTLLSTPNDVLSTTTVLLFSTPNVAIPAKPTTIKINNFILNA